MLPLLFVTMACTQSEAQPHPVPGSALPGCSGAGPVLSCRGQLCTHTSDPSLHIISHKGTHTHSFPAFPLYPCARNCTQGFGMQYMTLTPGTGFAFSVHRILCYSYLPHFNSSSTPFPNKIIELLLLSVIPPPF